MKSKKNFDPVQDPTEVQVTQSCHLTLRCHPCECAQPGHFGKTLGKMLGVDEKLLASLRSAGACIELPCQRRKSKRIVIPL